MGLENPEEGDNWEVSNPDHIHEAIAVEGELLDDSPSDPDAPRHQAAIRLAWLFSASFLVMIVAEMSQAIWYGAKTSDSATTLMLTVGSLLVGVSSGYLVRNINTPPKDRPELQNRVGMIMTSTLGAMLLIMSLAHLTGVVIGNVESTFSNNVLNILVVLLSGIIGALTSYLGISASKGGSGK
jgi:hypothetical protein